MSVYIKGMEMPVDCMACRIACDKENYGVIGRPPKCPLIEAKTGDLISRADAIEAIIAQRAKAELSEYNFALGLAEDAIRHLPSAEAEPKMTEEVREALMRLVMCAREECDMCKYKDKCGFDFQYKISTENMHTILDALSAEAEWIPCSERLPKKGEVVLITNGKGNVRCGQYRSEYDVRGETHYWWWKGKTVESVLAWMPLPKPYREDGEDNGKD